MIYNDMQNYMRFLKNHNDDTILHDFQIPSYLVSQS